MAGVLDSAALLSLFKIGGRFFWASLWNKLRRKMTSVIFFVLGELMYILVGMLTVGLPLAWGVYKTLIAAGQFFN